jgi:pimeloyl-ACP methyl ester carboxylesterase
LEVFAQVDGADLMPRARTPTLVLHARQDNVIPFAEGRRLAAVIPGAQFVELDSRNHVLQENEPAWDRFREAVPDFVGISARGGEDPAFAALSTR